MPKFKRLKENFYYYKRTIMEQQWGRRSNQTNQISINHQHQIIRQKVLLLLQIDINLIKTLHTHIYTNHLHQTA